jgi:nucleolar protein 56
MHPWISRSPRWQRGKISRTLASKAIIAARSDAFGGKVWGEEQVGKVEEKVQEIREKYPRANRG